MKKALIAYFSATGTTARAARRLARALSAETFEIVPERRYSPAELNWHSSRSRSSVEMKDSGSRPALSGPLPDAASFDVLFVGFPIWWGVAPRVVRTFLEALELSGKTVVPFATSGGSGMSEVNADLRDSIGHGKLLAGRRLSPGTSESELRAWGTRFLS